MNSCSKGKRGERAWRDQLREAGYARARRGKQYSGNEDAPDVICPDLPLAHWEVKWVEALNLWAAMEQAKRDAGTKKKPFVAHKRNSTEWLVTMPARVFFEILREGAGCLDYTSPEDALTEEEQDLEEALKACE